MAAKAHVAEQDEAVPNLEPLDEILKDLHGQPGAVIPILQRTQDVYGYLPRPVLNAIAQRTGIPISTLFGVATFYAQFHLHRRGKNLVRICDGTACHVRGAGKNVAAACRSLGVAPGQTTPDYKHTVEIVYCLGSCGLSPVAVVNDKVYGRLGPDALVSLLNRLPG